MFVPSFRFRLVVISFAALLGPGCGSSGDEPADPGAEPAAKAPEPKTPGSIESRPLNPAESVAGPLFQERSGLDFRNTLEPQNIKRYLDNGSGVTVSDYDGDGRLDVFLNGLDTPGRLFRQTDTWRFEDVTEAAGIAVDQRWGTGASFADVDGDGDDDLFLCYLNAANRLYLNQGDGTFRENASAAGLAHTAGSIMGAFADYDNDGDLDLYLLTYRIFHVTEEAPDTELNQVNGKIEVDKRFRDQLIVIDGNFSEAGHEDVLYRNRGDGTYEKATRSAGLEAYELGLSATWWDYNNDRYPDLYVANDFYGPDRLYRNNRDGTFTDVLPEAAHRSAWYAMGSDAGDLNNDGLLDYFVVDMEGRDHLGRMTKLASVHNGRWFLDRGNRPQQYARNALYLNTGTERFAEVAQLAGLARTDWSWAARLVDLDNDGLVDVFVGNGHARDVNDLDVDAAFQKAQAEGKSSSEVNRIAYDTPELRLKNMAFRNRGGLRFEDRSAEWGLDFEGVSHGAVFSDLDGDGDQDLIVNNLNDPVSIYENTSDSGNRLLVELVGVESNRRGVGARVLIRSSLGVQVRELSLSRGYQGADAPLLHFGLGADPSVDELTVFWPSGAVQRFTDLPADHRYRITEPGGADPEPAPAPPTPLFEPWTADGLDFAHEERDASERIREPFLPFELARQGPAVAWEDIDGDGLQDLWIGGAAGGKGALFKNLGGSYKRVSDGPWVHERAEDVAGLWFEADGKDGPDLYIASGGVEGDPGEPHFADRLLLNDGAGGLSEAPSGSLPEAVHSSSSVVATDFDRDGDLDLFVGARSVPGRFGELPESRLLQNDGGRFTDVTDRAAPGLRRVGLVTAALWSDLDGDAWPDLLLSLDWGPVTLFRNQDGRLRNATSAAGLSRASGWWRGLASGDVDNDGDLDVVVGNLGLNTSYAPSSDAPVRLYHGDVEGRRRLIESYTEAGRELPRWNRLLLHDVLPGLERRFPTHESFGKATLQQVFGSRLRSLDRLEVTRAETALLRNRGDGNFTIEPLPGLAQAAPVQEAALVDADSDGNLDLVLAQNDRGLQPVLGEAAGGLSLLLLGDGGGGFAPVRADRSGIAIPGDARSLTTPDLDNDGRPDLMFGINGERSVLLRRAEKRSETGLVVALKGPPGNPGAVGARVTARGASGRERVAERQSGSGFRSQSPAVLYLELGGERITEVEVRWPDGSSSRFTKGLDGPAVLLAQP